MIANSRANPPVKFVPPALPDIILLASNKVFRPLEDIPALKLNIPLTFNYSISVYLDIFTSPFPEHYRLLERMIPGILLPIFNVICELRNDH